MTVSVIYILAIDWKHKNMTTCFLHREKKIGYELDHDQAPVSVTRGNMCYGS